MTHCRRQFVRMFVDDFIYIQHLYSIEGMAHNVNKWKSMWIELKMR